MELRKEVVNIKNISIKRTASFVALFVIAGSTMLWLGHYRTLLPDEAPLFRYSLGVGDESALLMDIQDQGLPKRLAQPGRLAVSTGRHGGGGYLRNADSVSHWIKVRTTGFDNGAIWISSNNPSFNDIDGAFSEIQSGEEINLTVNLRLPYFVAWTKFDVGSGSLVFTDHKTGEALGEMPIRVINSARGSDDRS